MYSLLFLRPRSLTLRSLCHSSPPSFSSATAAVSPAPAILTPNGYHLRIPTCTPGALSDPSHRSNGDHVAMYCSTVFWRRRVYDSIVWNPASSLAVNAEVYVHLPLGFRCRSCPTIRLDTWSWNTPQGPYHGGEWPPRSPIQRATPPEPRL